MTINLIPDPFISGAMAIDVTLAGQPTTLSINQAPTNQIYEVPGYFYDNTYPNNWRPGLFDYYHSPSNSAYMSRPLEYTPRFLLRGQQNGVYATVWTHTRQKTSHILTATDGTSTLTITLDDGVGGD